MIRFLSINICTYENEPCHAIYILVRTKKSFVYVYARNENITYKFCKIFTVIVLHAHSHTALTAMCMHCVHFLYVRIQKCMRVREELLTLANFFTSPPILSEVLRRVIFSKLLDICDFKHGDNHWYSFIYSSVQYFHAYIVCLQILEKNNPKKVSHLPILPATFSI